MVLAALMTTMTFSQCWEAYSISLYSAVVRVRPLRMTPPSLVVRTWSLPSPEFRATTTTATLYSEKEFSTEAKALAGSSKSALAASYRALTDSLVLKPFFRPTARETAFSVVAGSSPPDMLLCQAL